jgi:hypothetical protein
MPHLYVNSKGKPWTSHSYSAGCLYDKSPLAYYLQKILGWKERENKARFAFGKAIEESIQYYHEHNGEGAAADFLRRWEVYRGTGQLVYTNLEKDWETCKKIGHDMIRLYVAMQPSLPIPLGGRSVFQRTYSKQVFPGDKNYGGIEDAGKLDIVCYADIDHPRLSRVNWKPEYGAYRPLIVDIKTSAVDFPEQPGMAAYDAQLRRYSWLSGIRDVSLLWFKKSGLGYKRGYSVTFIEPAGQYAAGEEAVVAQVDGENIWVFKSDFMLEEMDRAHGKNAKGKTDQTKEGEERGQEFLKKYGLKVHTNFLTRQRLQFNAGYVSQQSANEAGKIAARQIVSIVNSWKNNDWPDTFGIRYPKDDRNDSYFRAFVLKDENFKNQNFVKSDEESFDSLFEEDEP